MLAIHPGEILREEYMAPLGLSANALAIALGIPATRIHEILHENRKTEAHSQRLHKEEQLSYNTLQGYFHICGAEQKEAR